MNLFNEIIERKEKIGVVGLGYVGMPIAVAFAQHVDVVGYDINRDKIDKYLKGIDPTNEVGDEAIRNTTLIFTNDATELEKVKFLIVAVPTPINADKTPDLSPVIGASELVGKHLTKGAIVVYESTVYPGVTEDICVPILEKQSGLKCGEDFFIGYSPERINPGDKVHTLEKIMKIVSGMNDEVLDEIAKVYELVIEAGVHRAGSIKVAEAAKVVENSQRDINIAFMNELAMVFDRMGIDTKEVIEAMNTKWNSLGFYPGLVGGHCIGVDPYYFVYEAEKLGYHSQIILSGRKINDGMGRFVTDAIIKKLIQANKVVKKARVYILGITFKENCPDIRNTKVVDIISELQEYGIEPIIVDPNADTEETRHEYGIELAPFESIEDADCLVFAVAHHQFKSLGINDILKWYKSDDSDNVLIDIKSMFDTKIMEQHEVSYWRL